LRFAAGFPHRGRSVFRVLDCAAGVGTIDQWTNKGRFSNRAGCARFPGGGEARSEDGAEDCRKACPEAGSDGKEGSWIDQEAGDTRQSGGEKNQEAPKPDGQGGKAGANGADQVGLSSLD
jgi:hypothetical protein